MNLNASVEQLTDGLTHGRGLIAWALGSGFAWLGTIAIPTTNPLIVAGIVAVSGSFAALLTNWPKIMRERTANQEAESQRWQRETAAAISRIHDSYKIERELHSGEIATMRTNSQRYQQIIGLERKAKHAVVGEWNNAQLHVQDLREIIILANIKPLPEALKQPNYREVVGPFDDQIATILALIPEGDGKPQPQL